MLAFLLTGESGPSYFLNLVLMSNHSPRSSKVFMMMMIMTLFKRKTLLFGTQISGKLLRPQNLGVLHVGRSGIQFELFRTGNPWDSHANYMRFNGFLRSVSLRHFRSKEVLKIDFLFQNLLERWLIISNRSSCHTNQREFQIGLCTTCSFKFDRLLPELYSNRPNYNY